MASLPEDSFPGRAALQAELDRAEVVEPHEMPADVVTMNSTVRFVMESTGESFEMTLVYPRDSTGDPNRISIVAPVGSALLGLSVGESIEWPRPGGGIIRVRIDEILYQPESAGDLHR
ncbi:nucleoside diphosphate kinase regulator [Ectothiorhodospira sp. BSL-9]|uniref:nucleoside diphosphate kinase regulator n=1 Tax=Ectothiorhodospira sp. BSL-9 TaxID=1442136 RepID=UPI0007B4282A|nr:nucleoside diphosphate kinase regulator [Ectothiorhodospira sp. BSL-9]ANB03856.1 nucleoside diphosphate kinase regulator [Ectothiorhodospira sp. BSL-9]